MYQGREWVVGSAWPPPFPALRGLDLDDPTTGEIRSNTTDRIACWLIDNDHNEESLFGRHDHLYRMLTITSAHPGACDGKVADRVRGVL